MFAVLRLHTLGMLANLALLRLVAVGARRLHDTGKSGWFQLVYLIPFVGLVLMICLRIAQPSVGPNEYGSSASSADAAAAVGPARPEEQAAPAAAGGGRPQ